MWVKLASIGIQSKVLSYINRDYGRKYLVNSLGSLPGLPAKAAQFLGAKYSIDKVEQPQAMSLESINKILRDGLGSRYSQIAEIESRSFVASLGQVHRVKVVDQPRAWACKVQFPNVRAEMSNQLNSMIKVLLQNKNFKKFSINVEEYVEDFSQFLMTELNYLREVEYQNQFHAHYQDHRDILVPKPRVEWTQENILFQDFIDHEPFVPSSRNIQVLFRFFFESLFKLNIIHADLQLKNLAYSKQDNKIVIFDYGSCLRFDHRLVTDIKNLIDSCRSMKNDSRVVKNLIELGFDENKLMRINESIHHMGRILLAPFIYDCDWGFVQDSWFDAFDSVSSEDQWWLRSACPPWFLFFMRPLFQLYSLGQKTQSKFNLAKLLDAAVGGIKPACTMDIPKKKVIGNRRLRVLVRSNGETIGKFDFPVGAIHDLEYLTPESLNATLVDKGIEIKKIKLKALQGNLDPQILFELSDNNKYCKVWIE